MTARSKRSPIPARETLAAFFRMEPRERVRVPLLAQLLGVSDERAREILRADGVHASLDSVQWPDAAAYLFDAWPRAQIIGALDGDLARRIPEGFHPVPVQWHVPLFVIRAIEHQATLFTSASVDDYVADILFSEIQPATIAAFLHDAAFLAAYRYPFVD